MTDPRSPRPTRIRRTLDALDRATGGFSSMLFTKLDKATSGTVTEFAHRSLYRLRMLTLRGRVAVQGRDLSLLAEPRSKDIAVAESEEPSFAKARNRGDSLPRILFASEMRPAISGNLLRIRDRMLERGLDGQFDMVCRFRTLDTVTPEGTLLLAATMNSADIILIDDYFPLLNKIKLREDQRLIQVWHAGSGFKSVGYSRFGNYGSPRLTDTHRKYTFAICGSAHLVPVYAEVFGIPEDSVIPTGLPRIDTFLDPDRVARVKDEFKAAYPNLASKRKILFAPTFRGEGARTAFYDYSQLDFERLYEMCGDEYVLLIRMHHFISDPPPIPEEFADRIFDFSHFPDGNDLLHSTDILITDYSSILYEFSLLSRPMLFFAYDRDVYAATRGFHRPYDEIAPGKVCLTFDALVDAIENEDFEEWRIDSFRNENFDYFDTHSADRVIDQIILADPRTSPDAVSARDLDARRLDRARRLAAQQFHEDHPEHEGAIAALQRYAELDVQSVGIVIDNDKSIMAEGVTAQDAAAEGEES